METIGLCERRSVMNALTQGRELANELKRKLPPSREACDVLVQNIVSSYENALALLSLIGNSDSSQFSVNNLFESPISNEGSPSSEGSEQSSKKRKTLPRWSEQVRVCSGTGSVGQIDDGHSWRKYGQKDILGANHPRAYYRCTHRNTQGCLATKQVQRSDDDPSTYEIGYRGKHSCRQERVREKKEKRETEKERVIRQPPQQMVITSNEQSSSSCLKTENQELDSKLKHFPSFSFPSTPIESFSFPSTPIESEKVESPFFSEASNFMGTSYSPPFLSPATSESFFSLSPFGFQDSDSDIGEIASNPTPYVTSFTFGDLDFLENLDEFDNLTS
ncbi:hypothetical protein ACS0TY_019622 [Phlomoides rotata]